MTFSDALPIINIKYNNYKYIKNTNIIIKNTNIIISIKYIVIVIIYKLYMIYNRPPLLEI